MSNRPPIISGNGPHIAGSPWLTDGPPETDTARLALAQVEEVGPIDPTAGMGVEPMLELPCAEPDCAATLPVQPRHAENLTGWRCRNHKDTTA